MTHTLSLGILDDLTYVYGPEFVEFEGDINQENVAAALRQLLAPLREMNVSQRWYFDSEFFQDEDRNINSIAKSLTRYKYFVENWHYKYYSIALAVDFCRFEVVCNGFSPEVIKWRAHDEDDPVKGPIHELTYDEDPFVTLTNRMRSSSMLERAQTE